MHETVEVACGLLDLLSHVVVHFEVEHVCYEVEGILVVLDFGVEGCEIEAVGEIFFVDIAEILVAFAVDELGSMCQ